jgi:hypothetical protein
LDIIKFNNQRVHLNLQVAENLSRFSDIWNIKYPRGLKKVEFQGDFQMTKFEQLENTIALFDASLEEIQFGNGSVVDKAILIATNIIALQSTDGFILRKKKPSRIRPRRDSFESRANKRSRILV